VPLHPAAATGFARDVAAYERGRPSYPPEAGAAAVPVGDGLTVEVGAGSGKFTRLLAPRRTRIVAVEPVAAMRAHLSAAVPSAGVVAGTAEALPIAGGAADLVAVAQAFHWFANPAALAELHRVLHPEGRLALVWNEWSEEAPWELAFREIRDRHRGDTPQYRTGRWRDVFDAPGQPWFGPLHHRVFRNEQVVTPAEAVDRVASTSYIAALPPAGHAAVREELAALLPDVAAAERLVLAYRTDVFVTQRA
jgi:SAM-dependent methyltransferase